MYALRTKKALYILYVALLLLVIAPFLLIAESAASEDAGARESFAEVESAVNFMRALSKQKNYNIDFLLSILDEVQFDEKQEKIITSVKKPVETVLTWASYQKRFLTKRQITGGVEFWNTHSSKLQRASQEFGVPPEIIVATIGIESFYGENIGSYRAIDSLVTLSFMENHRQEFYQKQLTYFIELADHNQWSLTTIASIHGSYSGALGPAQFIPSSIMYYAIDWDGDDVIDMISDFDDIIGSIANYYHKARWKRGKPIMEQLKQAPKNPQSESIVTVSGTDGIEYWRIYPNYRSILRYNNSDLYALAVYHLSRAILYEKNNANNIE